MKKLTILAVVLMFTALFTVSAFAQADDKKTDEPKKEEKSALLATWEVTIYAPGQDLPGTFKLEKDGDNYKGVLTTDLGEVPLRNIKITEDSFTSDISPNVQGQVLEGTMSGKVAEGKLSGEITLAGLGAISYSGKKAEK
jgi:hypothetical protein